MCILATEFNFMEKLAGIPGGGGSKASGLILGNGWIIVGGPVKDFHWSAVSDFLQGVLQGFLGAL